VTLGPVVSCQEGEHGALEPRVGDDGVMVGAGDRDECGPRNGRNQPLRRVDVGMVVGAVDDEHRDIDLPELGTAEVERMALGPHLQCRQCQCLEVVVRVGAGVGAVGAP